MTTNSTYLPMIVTRLERDRSCEAREFGWSPVPETRTARGLRAKLLRWTQKPPIQRLIRKQLRFHQRFVKLRVISSEKAGAGGRAFVRAQPLIRSFLCSACSPIWDRSF